MKDEKKAMYQAAREVETLLTFVACAGTALLSFANLSSSNLSLAEEIHYQVGALGMVDGIRQYLPQITLSLDKLERHVMWIQQKSTEAATTENEKLEKGQ